MNSIFSTYQKVFKILPKYLKTKFWRTLAIIIITGVIDFVGLASLIPVLASIADPELLSEKNYISDFKNWMGVVDNNIFLLIILLLAFLFFAFRSIVVIYSNLIQNRFIIEINEFLGVKTYESYLYSDYQKFAKRDASEIVRELTLNSQHFSRFLVMPLLLLTSELFVLFLVVTAIALYDLKVFIMLIATIFPVAFLFNKIVKKRLNRYGVIQNELTPILHSNSSRGMHGYVDVKLRNKEGMILNDYKETLNKLNNISVITAVLAIIPSKLFELVTIGGLVLIFIYCAYWMKDPSLTLPLIAIYTAAGYRVIPSLSKIVPAFMQIEQYKYLFNVFGEAAGFVHQQNTKVDSIEFKNQIEVKNLAFKFSSSNINLFEDINLKIKKGEIVGMVGKTGSGKTTLIKIIAGFLKPEKGAVIIDDKEINSKNVQSWMSCISYVQQAPYLEKAGLIKNIAFLEDTVDYERLNQAIDKASLREFVNGRNLEEIQIEEYGKNLSGGQKQRIAIARALYHKADLIILDEATSALDSKTEADINETIYNLKGSGITLIIIAHRISTLVHCDRIFEVNEKKIKEVVYDTLK